MIQYSIKTMDNIYTIYIYKSTGWRLKHAFVWKGMCYNCYLCWRKIPMLGTSQFNCVGENHHHHHHHDHDHHHHRRRRRRHHHRHRQRAELQTLRWRFPSAAGWYDCWFADLWKDSAGHWGSSSHIRCLKKWSHQQDWVVCDGTHSWHLFSTLRWVSKHHRKATNRTPKQIRTNNTVTYKNM